MVSTDLILITALSNGQIGLGQNVGDGIYDVTFTFNSVTKEVSATAVRTDTDGISQIAGDVKAKSVVFNLQGHRVSTHKQGVYIINGKKVVVK